MVSEVKNIDKFNTRLLPIHTVSKELGVPKSGVQALIHTGALNAVDVGGKVYVTTQSLFGLLGQEKNPSTGEKNTGYPVAEELESPLTKYPPVVEPEKARVSMTYKGSVSRLADGRFMVQIDKGKSPEGKRMRENKSFHDETEANEYLKKRLAELNKPQYQPVIPVSAVGVPTAFYPQGNYTTTPFEEYALQLLNEGVGKATTRTIESYRRGLHPVVMLIGKLPMSEITPADLKKVFQKLSRNYADSNIKRSFTVVRLVMEHAFDNDDIPKNPMKKLKCPKSQKPTDKEQYPFYSDEDIKILFETSKEYSQELHTMFTLLECTGMRPAEMRALEWDSFNPQLKTIRIKQAITAEYEELKTLKKAAKSKEIVSVTKSKYGVRTLYLSDMAVLALLDWKKAIGKSRNKLRRDSTFIFPNSKGSFKSETSCQSVIQRYRETYELEDMGVVFYKFRHTMCTRLILAGQPIPVIQRIMGDNTADVIMKIYTHVNEEMARKSAQGFYEDLNKLHSEMAS